MTDPFLFSSPDEGAAAARAPREIPDVTPAEIAEWLPATREVRLSLSSIADDLHEALEAAGFHAHDPYSAGGGFHIATHMYDDAVLVCWAPRQQTPDGVGQLERAVAGIMNPAVHAILQSSGFSSRVIPEGEDNAGCVMVFGRTEPPA